MCVFPNIQYANNYIPLHGDNVNSLPPSPKGMYSILLNKGIIDEHFLDGINNMTDLEATIFNLIDHYPENNTSLERIFHLIQIWGGRAGRKIYIDQGFNWEEIEPCYRIFIDFFRSIDTLSEETLEQACEMVNTFWESLHGAGYSGMAVAFITKHSRFWMHRNMSDNMLPIYDSTFSENVMQKGKTAYCRHLPAYWKGMIDKAEKEHVSLTSLERQLFNYFNN